MLVASAEPNPTAMAPVKPVPVTVTIVPPPTGPVVGAMLVTTGAAMEISFSRSLAPARGLEQRREDQGGDRAEHGRGVRPGGGTAGRVTALALAFTPGRVPARRS